METRRQAALCKEAAIHAMTASAAVRARALELMAEALAAGASEIAAANEADLRDARDAGLAAPLLKRLAYGPEKIELSISGIRSLLGLPDPVGKVLSARLLDDGLVLRQVACPIGLVAMIFESRPDALAQMAALAAKSGCAAMLKGGSEAARTNRVLSSLLAGAGLRAGLPEHWLACLETRAQVAELLELDDSVDLVVPRGSKEFVRSIMSGSRIPVLGHSDGVCHVYLHEDAPAAMAAALAVDSKAQYPAACNAAEVLLVHARFPDRDFAAVLGALQAAGVRLELCPRSRAAAAPALDPNLISPKDDEDWSVEYLDLRMAVRVVDSLPAAIAHINRYGSRHTDAIVTGSREAARAFMAGVDSSSVYWNASTRFADGYRYGLGAELGIATGKLHARGPVGVEGLMTYKWELEGSGQVVADYASGAKRFVHRDIAIEGRAEDAEQG